MNTELKMAVPEDEVPVLRGGFAPVTREIVSDQLVIEGAIPHDLNGLYARNGPNRQYAADGRYHWFDGDGMLHALRFERGRVEYKNRWIHTRGLTEERSQERFLWRGIKEAPLRERLHQGNDGGYKNTANTDVKWWNGKLVAMWYLGGSPYLLDAQSLDTERRLDIQGQHGPLPISAHSKVDERTGEFIFFAYDKMPPYMHYGVVSADGKTTRVVPIDLPGPRLPHDMAITPNYSILHDLPLFYDMDAFKLGRHKLKFYNDVPTRFGIIPRHGDASQIRWFEAKSTFIYHVSNAWEEGDEVVMQGTPYRPPEDSADPLAAGQRIAKLVATLENDCVMYEWRFNLKTGTTKEGLVTDAANMEFPSTNPLYQGLKSRYSWNVLMGKSRQPEEPRFTGLSKVDTQTGRVQQWSDGADYWYSEAPFAPKENATAEDDGYLVGFVWNGPKERSEAHVFDAHDLTRGPLARIHLPQRVPHGFHSVWVDHGRLGN